MIIKTDFQKRKKRKKIGLFFCRLTKGKWGRGGEWREGTTFRDKQLDIQGDR